MSDCVDPKLLNQALKRNHYPLPTIEDFLPELTNARCFTVLDAENGFWHVSLDEESSYATTFGTPWGIEDTDGFECHSASHQPLKNSSEDWTDAKRSQMTSLYLDVELMMTKQQGTMIKKKNNNKLLLSLNAAETKV